MSGKTDETKIIYAISKTMTCDVYAARDNYGHPIMSRWIDETEWS